MASEGSSIFLENKSSLNFQALVLLVKIHKLDSEALLDLISQHSF